MSMSAAYEIPPYDRRDGYNFGNMLPPRSPPPKEAGSMANSLITNMFKHVPAAGQEDPLVPLLKAFEASLPGLPNKKRHANEWQIAFRAISPGHAKYGGRTIVFSGTSSLHDVAKAALHAFRIGDLEQPYVPRINAGSVPAGVSLLDEHGAPRVEGKATKLKGKKLGDTIFASGECGKLVVPSHAFSSAGDEDMVLEMTVDGIMPGMHHARLPLPRCVGGGGMNNSMYPQFYGLLSELAFLFQIRKCNQEFLAGRMLSAGLVFGDITEEEVDEMAYKSMAAAAFNADGTVNHLECNMAWWMIQSKGALPAVGKRKRED